MKIKRIVLKVGQIRRHNAVLKNWANRAESDEMAQLLRDGVIRTKSGRVILKGTNSG